MAQIETIEVTEATGTATNVFEEEFIWRIDHFRFDYANSIALKLAQGIECIVDLVAHGFYNKDVDKKSAEKFSRRNITTKPTLFITKVPDDGKYSLSFEIKPEGTCQQSFSYIADQKVAVNSRGIPAKGKFITLNNFRKYIKTNNSITLRMKFTLQDTEHNRAFDRQDFTIERTTIAKDLTKLFMSDKHSDINLNFGEDKIPAHKAILVAQSKFFEKVLADEPHISEFTFQKRAEKEVYIEFLRFIYNNTIKDLEKNFDALLEFSIEYEVEGLKKLCHLEIVSRVTDLFGRLTNRTRSVPLHILKDIEKVQKFHKMLLDMKEFMRAKPQESVDEPSTDDDIDEVIVMDISNFPINGDESENESEANFNKRQKKIAIEADEVFTDSMTKLMSRTLGTDEKKIAEEMPKEGEIETREDAVEEAIQDNADEPQIEPKLTDESDSKLADEKETPEIIEAGDDQSEKSQEKIEADETIANE